MAVKSGAEPRQEEGLISVDCTAGEQQSRTGHFKYLNTAVLIVMFFNIGNI